MIPLHSNLDNFLEPEQVVLNKSHKFETWKKHNNFKWRKETDNVNGNM